MAPRIQVCRALGVLFCLSLVAMSAHSQSFLDKLKDVADKGKDEAVNLKDKVADSVKPDEDIFSTQFTQDLLSSSVLAGLLSEEDSKIYQAALLTALVSGESQQWSGKDSDAEGEIKVTKESSTSEQAEVQVLQDRVEQMPPLEYIGSDYVATSNINVRGGPGTEYKIVDSLDSGASIHVLGKVEGKDWLVLDQGGVVIGFASSGFLAPAPQGVSSESERPSGATKSVTAEATRNCKDIEQSVVLEDGTEQVEKITACQGPNGWEIVS